MYKILESKQLCEKIYLMVIDAPRVAAQCQPGQFVIICVDEKGERVPLTICDFDRKKGTVTIVFQVMGVSTQKLALYKVGDSINDFTGPLGNPSELIYEDIVKLKGKRILFVAGGVGTAPVYPQVKWLKEHGVLVDVIVGAKTKDLVILEDEMKAIAGNLYITTDDGSYGRKGIVTEVIRSLVENGHQYDLCVAIGPLIMMKFVCLVTKELDIPTIVSMNPIMVDGTGMCGACRLEVGNDTKFACVDGPEFDGHKIDFDAIMKRQGMYKGLEAKAVEHYHYRHDDSNHVCTRPGGCICGGGK